MTTLITALTKTQPLSLSEEIAARVFLNSIYGTEKRPHWRDRIPVVRSTKRTRRVAETARRYK